eukprot:TRINITY_DN37416_c0_g3_i2.p1 TRINITY_DN37416_c0_g3~~TRINITY_DN37416_c0_g3_i2.p1  ORF type:complete len:447 (-),score=41.43 TRINITY_DN37416_c0_g3_i2:82-1422(-)
MPKAAPVKRRSTVEGKSSPSVSGSAVVHGPSCLCFTCVLRARQAKKFSDTCSPSVREFSRVNLFHSGYSSPDEEEEEVHIPRLRGKTPRERAHATQSDFLSRPQSPLHSAVDAERQTEKGTRLTVSSGSESGGPFDESTEFPLHTEDSSSVQGAAAIVEAWDIIRRRGDVSLLQQTVPSEIETLWNPDVVTSTGSRPTLEWFQRFADRLPTILRNRHHTSPHLDFASSSALRATRPSNEPLALGAARSIGEKKSSSTMTVPPITMRILERDLHRQTYVTNLSRLLQQTMHSMVTSSSAWEQKDQEDLVTISFALEELTKESVSLSAFALTNTHLMMRHAALQQMALPAQVQEDCLTSAFSAHTLFGPEAAASIGHHREIHPGTTRGVDRSSRFRSRSRLPPQTVTAAPPGGRVTRNFGRGRRAPSGRGSRAASRPYSRTSGRGQYS